jgi:lysophospholipase L1-like esterase
MLQKFYDRFKDDFLHKGSINIVCLGDSITEGCFEINNKQPLEAYPHKLFKLLKVLFPDKTFNVINSGIGGTTARFALTRLERDVFAYHPDLVTVAFGVNDYMEYDTYIRCLGELFDALNEREIPCIFLTEMTMNTYVDEPNTPAKYLDYAHKTVDVMKDGILDKAFDGAIALAKEKGIKVCDSYHKWKNMANNGVDTTQLLANRINHPNYAMHDFFAYWLVETMFCEE